MAEITVANIADAHGYLSLSPLSMQVGAIPKGAAAAFNYGLDKVRFLAGGGPRPPPGRGCQRRPKPDGQMIIKTNNTLEIEGSEKPALIAESLALLVPEKKPGS